MNEASPGDVIHVRPGVYKETVNMSVSNLVFEGEDYPEVDGFDNYGIPDIGNEFETIRGFSIMKDGIVMDGRDSLGNVISYNRFYNCGVTLSAMEYGGYNNQEYPGDVISYNVFHGGGISLFYGGDGSQKIIGNEIYDAECGIRIGSGAGADNRIGEISGNKIQGCDVGLHLRPFTGVNEVYNNIFNNAVNVQMDQGSKVNQWNKDAPIQGKNIIGGPYLGGNYWATPSGDGFSQTHLDTNGDGIAEEAYQVAEGVIDYLPLVTPRTEPEPVLPTANFRANTTRGNSPLSVLFTDLSENADSWSWDFDNNGQSDSTVRSPVYVYEVPGAYTVNLTVSNSNGTDSHTAVITVLEEEIPVLSVLPSAAFSMNVTSGYYPLTVLFADTSQNATGRSWDVNNDGVEDSNEASFVYTYTSRGTYTAKLTAINANGTDIKTATIDVNKKGSGGSSSGGSSSGGGGGGGGSPEPAKNVEVKELSQVFITNGKAVKFEFKNNATCVVSVSFDAIRNAGKTTTIVEQLKSKSVLVPGLPAGETYKSFNVWVGNSGYATSKNIESPGMTFKVEKAWVQEKQIEQDSITLSRYVDEDEHDGKGGSWTELQSSPAGEDDKFLYFSAETPGYGSFAISGMSSLKAPADVSLELSAENRSVGSLNNEEKKTGGAEESNETGTALMSIGIVIGALGVIGLVLKSMKN